ncbi:ABC transporter permease [Halorussus halophilus]|uniref:ABC transporter permease n=1 Tax=Halorussus halophilus TaxID=2650975 RepID=UPI00130154A9|nr:ABC transporter permease [Halorussus halophilus]
MIDRSALDRETIRYALAGAAGGLVVLVAIGGLIFPGSIAGIVLNRAVSQSTVSSALRLSVPIVFAALGGIFAEKSGVINIGLEGLLIIAAFVGVLATDMLGAGQALVSVVVPGLGTVPIGNIWLGFAAGILSSTLLALLFAVVCIEFKADQIIAGLAVWLIALGLAPFGAKVVYNRPNTPSVGTFDNWTVPLLSEIPYFGDVLFNASPTVFMMLFAVPISWYALFRTPFGRWVRASGENPKALDTAGVSVRRVRYSAVLLSGVLSGIGGAGLTLGTGTGNFVGGGTVNGRGFIAIVAYLFGNYNPFGAFGASMLFSTLDALQLRLHGLGVPSSLIQTIPYVTVIIVLALVGRTQIPEAAGEYYESGEE